MEEKKSPTSWQHTTTRCPYCVEGGDFRSMIDLTDLPGGPSFCTVCRHLANPREQAFKCLCINCRKLQDPEQSAGAAPRRRRQVHLHPETLAGSDRLA